MTILILGLLIFLGVHSVRIVADDWRSAQIARIGEKRWKGIYSIASGIGLVLIIWGYGLARAHPVSVWIPPTWARPVAMPLVAIAFILLPAAHVPNNHFKTLLGHPMVLGVLLWAFAHLLANGTLSAIVLFGAFLLWAIVDFIAARRRDLLAGTTYPPANVARDGMVIVSGLIAWALFAFLLHGWLFGVRPMG
ncbi:NnrU family protein [Paraburkholderia lacunae]|uniref:NnrU family protein n=1 Tax=Paraburkholderia lacunae TaxID=2211104 RepID=A0A370NBC3_9BURK|nr:NnrU family protein [Paraburkholderia lacunae]RDK02889.1 NnrU family protein [Paraburkholderia lacunae]